MSDRHRHSMKRAAFASWTLIWFGTILAVSPRPVLSSAGALLWMVGIMIQSAVAIRWIIHNPSSGATAAGV